MFRTLPYKTKQFFFVLIKLSIVVGAFYFIYNKLTTNDQLDISVFKQFLIENDVFSLKNVIILLFLSFFNMFFEIFKWQILVSFVKKISFYNSLKQSLGALTASLLTPNRLGDYGVKVMCYLPSQRKRIILLNLLGHMIQMCITFIFGILGLYYFITIYNVDIQVYKITRILIIFMVISGFALFGIKQNRFKIKGFSIEKLKMLLKTIPSLIYVSTFILSTIRYAIFSFQFYFLLLLFGVDVSYLNAMIVISSLYLLASIIPTISIFDVVIKGSIAVYLFSIVNVNELTILSITTLMWLLNFVLPSLIGSYFVLSFKPQKSID